MKPPVKRCHSDNKGHKTDGDTKEAVDDIKVGVNQLNQDSNVDQEKGNGVDKASEKDRQESSISAPEVIPEKPDRTFRGKGFQESIQR